MNSVIPIRALGDNFIYLCQYGNAQAFCIDPGDSGAVLAALKKHKLTLTTTLLTHHHLDHIGGVDKLKKITGCKTIGSDKKRMPVLDKTLEDSQAIQLGNISIKAIATPGHTNTSICYLANSENEKWLFTGDTMFIGGCGRIFECDANTMYQSLNKLAALPPETLLYPGHNYTIENYEFALTIEPSNQDVQRLLDKIAESGTTVPSTIQQQRQTNIFLRADDNSIRSAMNMPDCPAAEVFATLRKAKDKF